MANWFDMELPEGWMLDTTDREATEERMPDKSRARYIGVTSAQGVDACFLYSNGRIFVFNMLPTASIRFPTLQDAKNYIIMRCALNNWGEDE